MKVAIISKNTITSKKNGQTYDIYNGFSEAGEAVQIFLDEEQTRKFNLPSGIVPSKEVLDSAFESFPVVEAVFNHKGRLESVTV